MSKRDIELFIFDAYVAILKIEYISKEFSNAQDLLHDFKSWDSVIREFEIIGEASKHMIKNRLLDKKFQTIVDFRNIIIHEYFGIEPDEVYDIINNDLKNFKEIIVDMINNIENNLKIELIESFVEDNRYLEFVVIKLEEFSNG